MRTIPIDHYRPCHECGVNLTPTGGRCAECKKAHNRGWKRRQRQRTAEIMDTPPQTQPTPDILAAASPAQPAGWKRHGLTPAMVRVIRAAYERSDADKREELRTLNPDMGLGS